jgi:hypothetical protein
MPQQSITNLIGDIPYRMALAGGWIDQPFVSQFDPALTVDLKSILTYYQSRYAGAMYSGCGGGYLYLVSTEAVPGCDEDPRQGMRRASVAQTRASARIFGSKLTQIFACAFFAPGVTFCSGIPPLY